MCFVYSKHYFFLLCNPASLANSTISGSFIIFSIRLRWARFLKYAIGRPIRSPIHNAGAIHKICQPNFGSGVNIFIYCKPGYYRCIDRACLRRYLLLVPSTLYFFCRIVGWLCNSSQFDPCKSVKELFISCTVSSIMPV